MNIKFWKYWTVLVLVAFAMALGQHYFGAITFLLVNDSTYITTLILGIFAFANIKILIEHWKIWRKKVSAAATREHSMIWFLAEVVIGLGLLGTILGFIILFWTLFGPASLLDLTNQTMMKEAMATIASSMSTAMLTTLAGISSALIIRLQLVILEE